MNSPIKRHGGKHYLADKIVSLMPPHTRFLDAYCGGLNVLLSKPYEGIAEWANDLDTEITTFWYVLQAQPDKLIHQLNSTPFSEVEFTTAKAVNPEKLTELDRAVRFFILNRMSRQGLEKDYATPTTRLRRGMNEQVSAYWSAVDGLPELIERLRRIEIWNRPAVEAIKQLDGDDFLVYCDPPYMPDTRKTGKEYGKFEMTPEQHEELLKTLGSMQGKFILSGYDNPLYAAYELGNGWSKLEIQIANNASSSKSKPVMTECLWMNF